MNQPVDAASRYGRVMSYIAWGLGLSLLYFFFSDQLAQQHNPNQEPGFRSTSAFNEVVLERNRQGHYLVDGSINDYPVTFFLDTGATLISVPEPIAQSIGLVKGQRIQTLTANGVGTAYLTTIQELRFGNIELGPVEASINPNMPSDTILLGMSVLKQLDFEQSGNRLKLRQVK